MCINIKKNSSKPFGAQLWKAPWFLPFKFDLQISTEIFKLKLFFIKLWQAQM